MKRRHPFLVIVLAANLIAGCAVVPEPQAPDAVPDLPFADLVNKARQYVGKGIVQGGSVLTVDNLEDKTVIEALQIPLGSGQKPKSKDLSRGRLILVKQGFLDPEIYTKGRLITINGTLVGSSATESTDKPYPYLRIDIDTLHLWPVEKPAAPDYHRDPFWPYHPFWGPYPWWWHRHHWDD